MFTSKRNTGLVNGISVTIGDSKRHHVSGTRVYGLMMGMEQHVNSVCKSCFGQVQQIGHITEYLTTDKLNII